MIHWQTICVVCSEDDLPLIAFSCISVITMSNSLHTELTHHENPEQDTALDALHSFLDGELSAENQPGLFAHMAVCESCRLHMESVMKFRRLSRVENLTAPPALDAAMFKRLQHHKQVAKRMNRADDRRPLWNSRSAISLRATVLTAMLLFLTGVLLPAHNNDARITAMPLPQEELVTGSDEHTEFADLDFMENTSTVYVFYPGLTIEEEVQAQD